MTNQGGHGSSTASEGEDGEMRQRQRRDCDEMVDKAKVSGIQVEHLVQRIRGNGR